MKNRPAIFLAVALVLLVAFSADAKKLRIGVSLLPYYSFAANIVKDRADIVPLIENGVNTHGYRITPEDVKRASSLDAVIINGVGHDEFALDIIKAAGIEKSAHIIYANKEVALLPQSQSDNSVNSHTFVSITASIQQIYTIANELGAIDPANAQFYRQNSMAYVQRLRQMKASALKQIAACGNVDLRCATVHGAYSYLLSDFGFQIQDVVENVHGIEPSAARLRNVSEQIKKHGVKILFVETDFPSPFVATIRKETGVKTFGLSHLSQGEYRADFFERAIQADIDTICEAVKAIKGVSVK